LRLLLEHAPLPEVLALVAEVPLERLEAMSRGTLCPDETAFHIERALRLPGKWLDGHHKEVPARTLELLKNPDEAGLRDEDFDEDSPISLPVVPSPPAQPTAALAADTQPELTPAQVPVHDTSGQHGQVIDVVVSPLVEPHAAATNAQGAATGGAQAFASLGSSKAAARTVAEAATPAIDAADTPLAMSAVATQPKSSPNETFPMSTPELRKQNLVVLLQGKGAKSALARLLQIKPPNVSAMLSGRKILDQELCRDMARTLSLPSDWFEAARTAADIPANTLQLLAPLPREAGASADATHDRAEAEPAPAEKGGPPSEAASAPLAVSESHPPVAGIAEDGTADEQALPRKAVPQRGSQEISTLGPPVGESVSAAATIPVQADLLAPVEQEVQPAAQAPAPALQTEVATPPAPAPVMVPVEAPVSASTHRATLQTTDFTPMYSQPLVIEGGLAPITEALIKMLVLKARQGALSEDKAFDLLGAVRLL
jgi:hypothetical protein